MAGLCLPYIIHILSTRCMGQNGGTCIFAEHMKFQRIYGYNIKMYEYITSSYQFRFARNAIQLPNSSYIHHDSLCQYGPFKPYVHGESLGMEVIYVYVYHKPSCPLPQSNIIKGNYVHHSAIATFKLCVYIYRCTVYMLITRLHTSDGCIRVCRMFVYFSMKENQNFQI